MQTLAIFPEEKMALLETTTLFTRITLRVYTHKQETIFL